MFLDKLSAGNFVNLPKNCTVCWCDGKWLSKLYKTTILLYCVSFEKYTKGTGGGPGDPADYFDWENRPDITFDRHTSNGKLYLTCLYMRDKEEVGFKLCAKYDDVPNGVDGHNVVADQASPTEGQSVKKKSSASSNINSAMEETFKEKNTAIKAAADSFSISSVESNQRCGNAFVQNELVFTSQPSNAPITPPNIPLLLPLANPLEVSLISSSFIKYSSFGIQRSEMEGVQIRSSRTLLWKIAVT
jgi:hypothetical protein